MQINPAIPSYQTQKPTPQLTPAAQIAMSPAVQAAQQTAPTVRTQTVNAPQATGKGEQPREAKTATQGAQTVDTHASALSARVNAQGYRPRGSLLDLSV
ncbi:hypothetical protein [Azospirillum picis]|uniref:Uncharacterized protein YfaS (Alpha-2-macroglobulin family) n=1 Tax=Azospirillum picis TaxID=488438 RepID=A0ABU0MMF5_9PROT|nr:hypothetical protein [Azospirillum picis]MBP2301034.1 uncharacterized protein YfaS (alpha-2-macroglobulin family) [Azospirillum picis]MDQ0534346.1 uncharacterized protein YfaS (alpha-2-macroglobulin family) [Azospirillum picis]